MVKLVTFDWNGTLFSDAANCLNWLLNKNKDNPILLMLSGGSAFKILSGIKPSCLGQNITITVLDERFSAKPEVNNFIQLSNTEFYKKAKAAGCKFILTVPHQANTIEDLAESFEKSLRQWKKDYPSGVVIVTQGIGPDGHTAGIMPFPEDPQTFSSLFESDKWVVGYDAGQKNAYPQRVTTTITFLKNIVDHSVVFAVGEEKKKIIEKINSKQASLTALPAMVVWKMKDAQLFTDQVIITL